MTAVAERPPQTGHHCLCGHREGQHKATFGRGGVGRGPCNSCDCDLYEQDTPAPAAQAAPATPAANERTLNRLDPLCTCGCRRTRHRVAGGGGVRGSAANVSCTRCRCRDFTPAADEPMEASRAITPPPAPALVPPTPQARVAVPTPEPAPPAPVGAAAEYTRTRRSSTPWRHDPRTVPSTGKRKLDDAGRQSVIAAFSAGKSVAEVARQFGLSWYTVKRTLLDAGVKEHPADLKAVAASTQPAAVLVPASTEAATGAAAPVLPAAVVDELRAAGLPTRVLYACTRCPGRYRHAYRDHGAPKRCPGRLLRVEVRDA